MRSKEGGVTAAGPGSPTGIPNSSAASGLLFSADGSPSSPFATISTGFRIALGRCPDPDGQRQHFSAPLRDAATLICES